MNFEKELVALYPWLLQTAKLYCRSLQDAEDLVNDTVYKALLNKGRFDAKKALKPWCKVIMLNTYITCYHHRNLIEFVDYDDALDEDASSSASDSLLFREVLSVVRCCARLSCSIKCVLCYAKGYSYDEISELCGIPVGTVRSRISYGRKLIRKMLGQ